MSETNRTDPHAADRPDRSGRDNPKRPPRPGEEGAPSNLEKDPDDWVTGEERMTGAQASYLKTLSEEADVEFDPNLTKAEASKRIDELKATTGRGTEQAS